VAVTSATQSERPGRQSAAVTLGGEPALLDGSGALVLPERRTVVFADLHFEKGSAYAERGALLPPWDSAATLERMEAVLACHAPDRVICLGDSFHDTGGGGRMAGPLAGRLRRLADRYDWIWIAGNHDPEIPQGAGGCAVDRYNLGGLLFLHEPEEQGPDERAGRFQICGHFHPKARIRAGPRRVTRPCFIGDDRLLILPSFGAFTGGLDIMNPAIAGLFAGAFTAWLISNGAVYAFPSARTRFLPFET